MKKKIRKPKIKKPDDITFFVMSLKENYEYLDVKMLFDVIWEE